MSRSLKSTLQVFIAIVFMFGAFGTVPAKPVKAASPNVVISEVYGGGSNSGANYQNDFIELFNLGTTPVDLSTWSVQYASAAGTSWTNKTNLSGTIQPGSFYLIQEAGTNTSLLPLPTPDVIGTLNLSGTTGKLALLNNQTTLPTTGVTPTYPGIVDFIGFGTSASLYEGSGPTAQLSNTTSASRTIVCMDVDDNSAEFTVGPQTPQNSTIPASPCSSDAVYLTSTPANGTNGVLIDANLVLKFNKAVTPADGWYTLQCTSGGILTPAVSIVGTTITLDPVENFEFAEACILTVNGSLVDANMAYSPTIKFSTAANTGLTQCLDAYAPTNLIQGPGNASPYVGLKLATVGVVTADLQTTKQGFYIQDQIGDSNPLTSEGLFIYTGNTPQAVTVGNWIRVYGTVLEFGGLTEIGNAPSFVSCDLPAVIIPPVELSLPFADAGAADLEKFENMLVHFAQPLVINEYFNFDRYGEIVLSSKRLDNPTNVVAPGAEAITLQAANNLDKITLDDGVSAQNPEYLPHPNGGRYCHGSLVTTGSLIGCPEPNIFRGGDTVANLTAVVDYVAGGWKLVKTQPADYTAANPRLPAPDLLPGELRISSINTLNYFITLTTAGNICGPLGNMGCRGADDSNEFTRQRAKTIETIIGMASDITGLLELENDNPTTSTGRGPDYAIADIVEGLNATAGAGTYAYIATGPIGTDAIKAGLVYKPARVTPVGEFALLTSAVDPDFIDTCNRPVLAQTFRDNITQQLFTVAINHLKSKGSACAALNDIDAGDGQGDANLTRTMAAAAEVRWLETDPNGQGSEMYLIMGDLNSYAMEDPISTIKKGADGAVDTADDYFDLVQRFRELRGYPPSYGYVFDAQAGYLDGALANKLMASYVLDAKEWHINADEADVLDYNTNFRGTDQQALYNPDPYRSSDHDPILISLMLNHEPEPMDDAYTAYQNRVLTVDAPGVLANDIDDNIYDKISVGSITQPINGVVVMLPDGSFTYTPDPGFLGVDTFTYTMQATPGLMGAYETLATVTITVEFKSFDLYLPIISK